MGKNIYRIFDSKVKKYEDFYILQETNAEATRTFGIICNDKSTKFGAHPEDYTLFCIGEDCRKGGIPMLFDTVISVCNGIELVESKDA